MIEECKNGHDLDHLVSYRLHPNRIAIGFRLLARNLAIGFQMEQVQGRPEHIREPLAFRALHVDALGTFEQTNWEIVLYRPTAHAEHEHFYRPDDLIDREQKLGFAAWHFARANPAFGQACFGRDICSSAEAAYSKAFVEREESGASRLHESFRTLGHLPASCVDGPHEQSLLALLSQQHMLLKRWAWRRGLLEAQLSSSPSLREGIGVGSV